MLDPSDLPFNEKTRTAEVMLKLLPGQTDPKHHSHVKLSWEKPSRTLLHDFLGYFHFWHPEIHRPLTLKEWSRISTFGDCYQWAGSKKLACQRIGNSVPPLFMRAIALHIRHTVLDMTGGEPVLLDTNRNVKQESVASYAV